MRTVFTRPPHGWPDPLAAVGPVIAVGVRQPNHAAIIHAIQSAPDEEHSVQPARADLGEKLDAITAPVPVEVLEDLDVPRARNDAASLSVERQTVNRMGLRVIGEDADLETRGNHQWCKPCAVLPRPGRRQHRAPHRRQTDPDRHRVKPPSGNP